jgi:hypothetical protein
MTRCFYQLIETLAKSQADNKLGPLPRHLIFTARAKLTYQTARIKTVVYRLLFSHVFPHEYPVGIKCKTKSIRNYPFKNENLLDE